MKFRRRQILPAGLTFGVAVTGTRNYLHNRAESKLEALAQLLQGRYKKKFMKPEEIRIIIQQAAQAWIARDANAFANLFTPDGLFIVPGNRWVGPTQIRQVAAEFASTHSDVKIEIQQIVIEGDHAVVEWSWEDKAQTTGLRQKAEDAIAIDFKEGRISRWREYIDTQITK